MVRSAALACSCSLASAARRLRVAAALRAAALRWALVCGIGVFLLRGDVRPATAFGGKAHWPARRARASAPRRPSRRTTWIGLPARRRIGRECGRKPRPGTPKTTAAGSGTQRAEHRLAKRPPRAITPTRPKRPANAGSARLGPLSSVASRRRRRPRLKRPTRGLATSVHCSTRFLRHPIRQWPRCNAQTPAMSGRGDVD